MELNEKEKRANERSNEWLGQGGQSKKQVEEIKCETGWKGRFGKELPIPRPEQKKAQDRRGVEIHLLLSNKHTEDRWMRESEHFHRTVWRQVQLNEAIDVDVYVCVGVCVCVCVCVCVNETWYISFLCNQTIKQQ